MKVKEFKFEYCLYESRYYNLLVCRINFGEKADRKYFDNEAKVEIYCPISRREYVQIGLVSTYMLVFDIGGFQKPELYLSLTCINHSSNVYPNQIKLQNYQQ